MADPLLHDPEARERQRFTRRSLLLTATLRDAEGSVECDLLDFSAGGAKVRVQAVCGFPTGTELLLVIGDDHSFRGEVAWRDGEFLGLRFTDPPEAVAASIPEILQNSDARERRRAARSSVLWSGEIYGGLRRAKCEILNISPGGAKLHTTGSFPPGTDVIVRSIRFGEFQAQVVWRHGDSGTIGIRFLEEEQRIAQIIERNLPSIRKQED